MKALVVYAHPNPKSFNHSILETLVEGLKNKGNEVEVRDLYALEFNPILTARDLAAIHEGKTPAAIRTEQEFIEKADVLFFVYPIWWSGMPAILKGYIDKIFAYNFAYRFGQQAAEGLLKDKKVVVINTAGAMQSAYEQGMDKALEVTTDYGIFGFCGIEIFKHQYFYAVMMVDDATRKNYLNEVNQIAEQF